MKGRNLIKINQETMKKAVQHYFETVVFRPEICPKVEKVTKDGSEYGAEQFLVEVDTPVKDEPLGLVTSASEPMPPGKMTAEPQPLRAQAAPHKYPNDF